MGKAWASAAIVLLLVLVPLGLASPAALDSTVVAVPPSVDPNGSVGARGGYLNSVSVVDTAGTLTFLNADITAHDIVSFELGPTDNPWCGRFVGHHFCPLFASPLVGLGGEATVQGTDQLVPGTTYDYFCSVHHWMTGTLVAI